MPTKPRQLRVLEVQPFFDYEAEAAGDPNPEWLGYVARLQDPTTGQITKGGVGRTRPAVGSLVTL